MRCDKQHQPNNGCLYCEIDDLEAEVERLKNGKLGGPVFLRESLIKEIKLREQAEAEREHYRGAWNAEQDNNISLEAKAEAMQKVLDLAEEHFTNTMIKQYAGARDECLFCGQMESRSSGFVAHDSDCPVPKFKALKDKPTGGDDE